MNTRLRNTHSSPGWSVSRTLSRSPRAALIATLTASSVLLAACGVGAQNDAGAGEAHQTSFSEALDAFNAAGDESKDTDPAELTGVSNARVVGDVTPITDSAEPKLPVSLTDADNYDVDITDVSRILPLDLYGTTSRTVAGLGLRDNIIGRSVSSEEPSLKDLPVVTRGGHNLNVEAILNLKPSLVIIDHSIGPADSIDQIRDAGVTVVVLDPSHELDKIGDDIRTIAGVLGLKEEGDKLAERAEKERDEAIAAVKEIIPAKPLRTAFIYARGTGGVFFILGPDSGTSQLFETVGAEDVAAEAGITDMRPANAEALVEIDPDVMVMMTKGLESTGGLEGMLNKPGVKETKAGQNKRIVAVPDSQALSFGPQTGEMILSFAEALYLDNGED